MLIVLQHTLFLVHYVLTLTLCIWHMLHVRYSTLSDGDLLQLPVRELCAADALVVMWVTNKLRQQRFVKDRLFPHWNVTCLAEWYWLKVQIILCCVALLLI